MATRPSPSLLLALASTLSFAALTGCGDDETGVGGAGGEAATSTSGTPASSSANGTTTATTTSTGGDGGGGAAACGGADTAGCDVVIEPSDDDTTTIQEALIDDTDSGDVVCLCPGTYSLEREISLTVPDVTIQGVGETRDDVVLDFAGQTQDDDGVAVDSDGFTIQHLTVKNTPGNGIIVREAERVTFRDLVVTWDGEPSVENGAYAVYPVGCTQVLVEDTLVVGAADAGIYVGQSSNIIVRNNEVHQNVAGIEIENSDDADVYLNEAYDNTAGILVFVLPNLQKKDGFRTKVHDNQIYDNNHVNFAEEGTIVASVPPGIGALVLAADTTEIHDNTFTNNGSTSIVLISYETIAEVLGEDPEPDPETDTYLSEVYIHDNVFEGNGEDPQSFFLAFDTPVENVVWDGVVAPKQDATLCLSADDPPTYRNFNGVENIANSDEHETDTTAYECDEPVVEPQEDF